MLKIIGIILLCSGLFHIGLHVAYFIIDLMVKGGI